jgi:uncharacterized protein YyaL (SSP411 family)
VAGSRRQYQSSEDEVTRVLANGLIPLKPADDGQAISPNAAAALLALDLYEATKEKRYMQFAWRILYAFGQSVADGSPHRVGMAAAMDRYLAIADQETK